MRPNLSKADFQGPYNKLLYILPPDTNFTASNIGPSRAARQIFFITFEVMLLRARATQEPRLAFEACGCRPADLRTYRSDRVTVLMRFTRLRC